MNPLNQTPPRNPIEFEPLPSGPEKVVLDHDQDPTMISHDGSLEMENTWAMEFDEAPTLESKEKDSTNEHESFTLEMPQKPCSLMRLQSQACLVHCAHTRTTTTL